MAKFRVPRWTLLVGGVVLVLGIGGGVVAWMGVNQRETLVLEQDLANPPVVKALAKELEVFHSLYPRISVRMVFPGQEAPDVAILNQYPDSPQTWVLPLTPWSGSLWVLAARKPGLERLAQEDAASVAALRKGTLSAAGLEKLLAQAKAWGPAPLTLGNSHGWPYLLWVQAWTASTEGPGAAQVPPADLSGAAARQVGQWRAAGWFDAQAWPLGWAQGLGPLVQGKATFALLSAPLLSALPPAARGDLEYLPLPKREADPPWSLGRIQLLGVRALGPHLEDAKLLGIYLSSPGVTARLSQATGRPFFAWNQDSGKTPVVVPDWAASDPAVLQLAGKVGK